MSFADKPRRSRWFWIFLFIALLGVLGTLATGWNVVLLRDYEKLVSAAASQKHSLPLFKLIFGSLGFLVAGGGIVLIFIKLQREMRLNQLQSEFLATVSHELKTPIATLELTSALLRTESASEPSPENHKLWSSHQAELKRLREQVETLLEAARWQSGVIQLSRTRILIEEWIQGSWDRWQRILGPNSSLERQGDPLPVNASVDLSMLHLITDNLMDNARKFSSGNPQVILRTERTDDHWVLEVEDNGLGFHPSDSSRIFKRFFRAKTESETAIPGTGLGLSLASNACKALGLELIGRSEGHGKGAVFRLSGRISRP